MDHCIVCIVSSVCNQSSISILDVIFGLLYRCIDAIFNVGQSSFSFFSWHIYIVCLRHLWNVRPYARHEFSCSLVCLLKFLLYPLQNGPEYLTKGSAQLFIPLMRFLMYRLVSSSFFVPFRYSFLKCFPSSPFLWCPLPLFPSICNFPFLNFSWFDSSIPSVMRRFLLLIISMTYFSMPNSIPMSWLLILTACIMVSNSFHFWQKVWYCPCILDK